MNLKGVKIHEIYLFAFFLMAIMAVSNAVIYSKQVGMMIPLVAFNGAVELIFNFLWAFFFWWLWQNSKPKPQQIASDDRMLEIIGKENKELLDYVNKIERR